MAKTEDISKASVIIADDHEVVRKALVKLFATFEDVEVAALAEDGLEAIALCRKHKPDLLVLDVGLPLANGSEVFGEVRRWSPETVVAVFTGFTSVGMLADWVASGVDGLFLKSCKEAELCRGFRLLLAGERYVAVDVVARLENQPASYGLTAREREILTLIAAGLTTTQIAERLCISPKTVEKHRASLLEKFGVGSLAAMMTAAFRAGLLDYQNQL